MLLLGLGNRREYDEPWCTSYRGSGSNAPWFGNRSDQNKENEIEDKQDDISQCKNARIKIKQKMRVRRLISIQHWAVNQKYE